MSSEPSGAPACSPDAELRVRFSGHVQGVGFRAMVVDFAQGFSLCGWVRNRDDGTVELVLRGALPVCENLLERISHRFRGRIQSNDRSEPTSADLAELPTVNGVVVRPTV